MFVVELSLKTRTLTRSVQTNRCEDNRISYKSIKSSIDDANDPPSICESLSLYVIVVVVILEQNLVMLGLLCALYNE